MAVGALGTVMVGSVARDDRTIGTGWSALSGQLGRLGRDGRGGYTVWVVKTVGWSARTHGPDGRGGYEIVRGCLGCRSGWEGRDDRDVDGRDGPAGWDGQDGRGGRAAEIVGTWLGWRSSDGWRVLASPPSAHLRRPNFTSPSPETT